MLGEEVYGERKEETAGRRQSVCAVCRTPRRNVDLDNRALNPRENKVRRQLLLQLLLVKHRGRRSFLVRIKIVCPACPASASGGEEHALFHF